MLEGREGGGASLSLSSSSPAGLAIVFSAARATLHRCHMAITTTPRAAIYQENIIGKARYSWLSHPSLQICTRTWYNSCEGRAYPHRKNPGLSSKGLIVLATLIITHVNMQKGRNCIGTNTVRLSIARKFICMYSQTAIQHSANWLPSTSQFSLKAHMYASMHRADVKV